MKKILFIMMTISLFPLFLSALTTKQLATSINLAGKQRMLTQKMTKEALLVKAGIHKSQSLEKLQATRDLFDKTLKGLMHGDKDLKLKTCKNKKVQAQLKVVNDIWQSFDENIQKVIHSKASVQTYQKIQVQNLNLLNEMNKAVSMYVSQTKKRASKRAQAINLSGKERMLTQKMAKALLLVSQGISTKENMQDLQKTANLFEKILIGLEKGDKELHLAGTKLPSIQKQLKVGEKLWNEVRPVISKNIQDKQVLEKTINKLDTLLIEMNKTVKKFEKSIQREKQALKLSSLVNQFMEKKNIHNHIINLSGKQRMLTQKMSKLALLVSLNINTQENKKRLQKAYALYAKTLNGFAKGDSSLQLPATKNSEIAAYIKKLHKEWNPFKKSIQKILTSKTKNVKALGYVVSHNEKLLKMSNQLVQMFKHSAGKQTFMEKARANIVDVAGRQRMLTQKMTKEKLLILAKVSTDTYKKKLQKTVSLFDTSLKGLIKGNKKLRIIKPSNKKIIQQLKVVASTWKELKPLYLKDMLKKKELVTIVKENPMLLAQMNKAVSLSEVVADY